jgi:hypothetical protein
LVKPIVKIYSQGFYRNLFCIFMSFISFSMHFRISKKILDFLTQKKRIENEGTVLGRFRPKATTRWLGPVANVAQGTGAAVRTERGHHVRVPGAVRQWPDDHAVFTTGLSEAWGRRQAR